MKVMSTMKHEQIARTLIRGVKTRNVTYQRGQMVLDLVTMYYMGWLGGQDRRIWVLRNY